MRKKIASRLTAISATIAALLVAVIVFAAPSNAAFALTCNLNSVAQGRTDWANGFTYSTNHHTVDTSSIRYRSINRTTNTTASWYGDVTVQLWNAYYGRWENWTSRSNVRDITWNPNAKSDIYGPSYWNRLRVYFDGNGVGTPGYSIIVNF